MGDTLFSKVDQIGVVVKDLDKAVEFYQKLGIGPFGPPRPVDRVDRKYFGKYAEHDPSTFKVKMKTAKMGPVELELVEPVEGESLPMEFLKTHGEGINHIAIWVDDLAKEEAKLLAKGFKLMYRAWYRNGGGAAYFDTREVGGIWLELIQW
jgi:catechol 2,3-dioxygenase-like lactoylglutathione lyase family enzyme